jgi:hypothetical protein
MNKSMEMPNTKSFTKSKTIWGILGTIALSAAVPGIEAYKETRTVEGVLGAVLPIVLPAIAPAGYAIYGRANATKFITLK